MNENVGEGLGCFFICLGIAVVIWACSGFPGLGWSVHIN